MSLRRTLAAILLTTLAMPATSNAAELDLDQISAYLGEITEARARFTQINSDGSVATGSLAIKRPGRIRFEYNPPESALVMASGGALYVVDEKLGGDVQTYPLNQTPLGILLRKTVSLSDSALIEGIAYDGTFTYVTARDPENPTVGLMQLGFSDNPVALRQWVVIDSAGYETTVVLQGFETARLSNSLFRPAEERDDN